MPNYDFTTNLSPIDFELMVKDLLEADLGIAFENFRDGKDEGIDLRHSTRAGQETTIVQCKRFEPKAFSGLKSKLKREELPKISKLNPERYILATSVSLSPEQSTELTQILHPFIVSTADIYGRERLNSLLDKYPSIERQHNKLWIGTTGLIEEFLNSGIHVISRKEIEDSISSARLYVKNDSFGEALKILSEHRVCIISGIPGIGKTTLARMLLIYFKEQGYEIVKIDDDISEVRGLTFHGKPKFYLYDDFLGQTSLSEKFNKNEDKRLLSFIDQISRSEKSVFVLTTREYILKQAGMIYEPFDRARLDCKKCIIDLSKYSRRIRAQILYNHLYFSDLESDYVRAIVKSGKYKDIIDHPNYSPRLVQYLTSMEWVNETGSENYISHFLTNLDNPILIWEHAYERQLRRSSQDLLLVLATLPFRVSITDLKSAFEAFRSTRSRSFGESLEPLEFKDSLRELEGTFVSLQNVTGGTFVAFHNPSIRDFIESLVAESQTFDHLSASTVFFDQLSWLFGNISKVDKATSRVDTMRKLEVLEGQMIANFDEDWCRVGCQFEGQQDVGIFRRTNDPVFRLRGVLSVGACLNSKLSVPFAESQVVALSLRIASSDDEPSAGLEMITLLNEFNLVEQIDISPLVASLRKELGVPPMYLHGFEIWSNLFDELPEILNQRERQQITAHVEVFLEEGIQGLFGISCDGPEEIRGVASRIEELGWSFGIDTKDICSAIEEVALEVEAQDGDTPAWEPDDDDSVRPGSSEVFSDSELDSMFKTLV